jgi:translation initiation factor IF-3
LSIPPRRPTTNRGAAPPQKEEGHRINHRIDAREVRLIGADGENVGVVPIRQAMMMAEEVNLDLVEVSPDAKPPVAKILDYGKFKYQEQKKANEARKKQKVIEIKEIKMRPMIDDPEYEVKMKAIRRFFEEGDKVKITLRFRGREMAHQELGQRLLDRVKKDTGEIAKVESEPRFEGRQIVMVLAPR